MMPQNIQILFIIWEIKSIQRAQASRKKGCYGDFRNSSRLMYNQARFSTSTGVNLRQPLSAWSFKSRKRQRGFEECYYSPFAGHAGRDNTMQKIKERYYWPSYYKGTVEMVSLIKYTDVGAFVLRDILCHHGLSQFLHLNMSVSKPVQYYFGFF